MWSQYAWRQRIYAETQQYCVKNSVAHPTTQSLRHTARVGDAIADTVAVPKPGQQALASALDPRTKLSAVFARRKEGMHRGRTRISVVDVDTLDAAEAFVRRTGSDKCRVAVLNMANDSNPGGGVESGCGAQEENLFRRTSLYMHLDRRLYPIGPTRASADAGPTDPSLAAARSAGPTDPATMIYSRNVYVFRQNEAAKYCLMPTPFFVDVITLAGLYCPKVAPDGTLSSPDMDLLREKLRLMFRVAAAEGRDTLVLSAIGCGAWRNPPEPVACVFKDVLAEFDGVFRDVQFAVLSTAPGGDISTSNLAVFQRVLHRTTEATVATETPAATDAITSADTL